MQLVFLGWSLDSRSLFSRGILRSSLVLTLMAGARICRIARPPSLLFHPEAYLPRSDPTAPTIPNANLQELSALFTHSPLLETSTICPTRRLQLITKSHVCKSPYFVMGLVTLRLEANDSREMSRGDLMMMILMMMMMMVVLMMIRRTMTMPMMMMMMMMAVVVLLMMMALLSVRVHISQQAIKHDLASR